MLRKLGILAVLAAFMVVSMAGTVLAAPTSGWSAPVKVTGLSATATRPSVFYDEGTYHLWYWDTASGTAQYAYSDDGKIWTNAMSSDLPTDAPFVFVVDETFYMYAPNSDGSAIDLHVSTDGQDWSLLTSAVFTKPDWATRKIDHPMVVYDGTQYRLYYQGSTIEGVYSIGVAISANIEGPFTDQNQRALTAQETWENGDVFQPWVVKEADGRYSMFYTNSDQSLIGIATSTDGFAFDNAGSGIISAAERGIKPTVVAEDGHWFLFIGGVDGIYYTEATDNFATTATISWEISTPGTPGIPDAGYVAISVQDLDLGNLARGQVKSGDLAVTNEGSLPVNIVLTLADGAPTWITVADPSGTLNASDTESIAVTATVPVNAATGAGSVTVTVTATAAPVSP